VRADSASSDACEPVSFADQLQDISAPVDRCRDGLADTLVGWSVLMGSQRVILQFLTERRLTRLPRAPIFESSFVADDCHPSAPACSHVELASSGRSSSRRKTHPLSGMAGSKVAAD
jgi:hypothetical protein